MRRAEGSIKIHGAVCLCAVLAAMISVQAQKGILRMESNYRMGPGNRYFTPTTIECPLGVRKIFPVPVDNTVGTSDLHNAVTLVHFDDAKVKLKEVRRNFRKYLTGYDYFFLPVFDTEFIAFTQQRGVVLFNVMNGAFEAYEIGTGVPDDLTYYGLPLEPDNRTFVFDICRPDTTDFEWVLKVVRLRDEKTEIVAEKVLGRKQYFETGPWTAAGGQIYAYDMNRGEIVCFDARMLAKDHALGALYRQNLESVGPVREILVHPSLPMAVIVGNGIWLARWKHSDPDKRLVMLGHGEDGIAGEYQIRKASAFQFSPDGTWIVFRDEGDGRDTPLFVAVPVDSTTENFLGRTVVLGRGAIAGQTPASTAWIAAPLSFVACDGHAFFKWELDMARR